jgi:hypothetical protein
MELFYKPKGVKTRWATFENPTLARGAAGLENRTHKGHAFDRLPAGMTRTLLDVRGSGTVTRIWMTISDRSPEVLRGIRIEMFWDDARNPAVSVPLGDFFGIALGRCRPFESALFSDPEGRSFNCFIPMPFRKSARITLTNGSGRDLAHLFHEIDLITDVRHPRETMYFHACWRRESPNRLGEDFVILPRIRGNGRFLGCNIGVIADPRYGEAWWGEGEVKVWFGKDDQPTLCGTGTEDYIGTGWGQGEYSHRTQGCTVADKAECQWAFYRYHLDDPVFFDKGCKVAIQTIGGAPKADVIRFQDEGAPVIPVSIDNTEKREFIKLMDRSQPVDLKDSGLPDGWCNFRRQDDWSGTAYFYLDSPEPDFVGV